MERSKKVFFEFPCFIIIWGIMIPVVLPEGGVAFDAGDEI